MHEMWADPVTENPASGDTEVWEFYNFTADAHPMHVHEIAFEVVNRQALVLNEDGETTRRPGSTAIRAQPESWENGLQGHGHRLPGRGHARPGAVQQPRPVRLALPHRRARGQRDDAALPHRPGAAGPAGPARLTP